MADTPLVTVNVPKFIEEGAEYDIRYRRTVKWDAEKGDFVRDGASRMVECSGEEGYMIWCYKMAQTERYSCLAYPAEIGTEFERAIAQDKEKVTESMIKRTITEALMVNPRTESVFDFKFEWDADEMHCAFKVKGIEWDKIFQIVI